MKYRILFIALSIFAIGNFSSAQEVTYPLNVNPALIEQAEKNSSLQRRAILVDTISVPIEDDFSHPGAYPREDLWLDSGVYINNNYSEKPFTIGIATFDGLNHYGQPYQPNASADSIADVLTSKPIDLVVPPGDTSVWFYFFYQPQGLGDEPESGDSLILQFKDTGNVWHTVWAVEGRPDTVFQRVNIQITDIIYLFKGFQFRFYNIATVNGNRDHWNLDYVSLKSNTFGNAPINDNTLVRPQLSLLTEYTSMPYSHYKILGSAAMKTEITDSIYNIDYGGTTYNAAAGIYQNGTQIFGGTTITSTLTSQVYLPYTIPLNGFAYPIQSTDSASFQVKCFIDLHGNETNAYNDTSYLDQNFYNYYSYDDGSVELSYGITGNVDVSVAEKFNIKMQDTLRGVQIYFNPTGVNVSNLLFQLAVWTDVTVAPSSSTLLYKLINQRPGNFLGINGYKTYLFDTTLIVGPGNIWVGYIQNDPGALYGLGLDRNIDSHNKMYYAIDGDWSQSSTNGSWMIRPLFGKYIPLVSVEEVGQSQRTVSFSVFPNPTTGSFHLQFENNENRLHQYQILDCLGRIVMEDKIMTSEDIDVSKLSKGIYIVRLLNKENNSLPSFQKLILQ